MVIIHSTNFNTALQRTQFIRSETRVHLMTKWYWRNKRSYKVTDVLKKYWNNDKITPNVATGSGKRFEQTTVSSNVTQQSTYCSRSSADNNKFLAFLEPPVPFRTLTHISVPRTQHDTLCTYAYLNHQISVNRTATSRRGCWGSSLRKFDVVLLREWFLTSQSHIPEDKILKNLLVGPNVRF